MNQRKYGKDSGKANPWPDTSTLNHKQLKEIAAQLGYTLLPQTSQNPPNSNEQNCSDENDLEEMAEIIRSEHSYYSTKLEVLKPDLTSTKTQVQMDIENRTIKYIERHIELTREQCEKRMAYYNKHIAMENDISEICNRQMKKFKKEIEEMEAEAKNIKPDVEYPLQSKLFLWEFD